MTQEEEAEQIIRRLSIDGPYFHQMMEPFRIVQRGDTLMYTFVFENGYAASVIRGPYTYGNEEGLWEMAVLDEKGDLTYDTPITDDVIGHLTDREAYEILLKIKALPDAKEETKS